MLNEKRHRCCGLGGGTRHLHHFNKYPSFFVATYVLKMYVTSYKKAISILLKPGYGNSYGGELGSTLIVKVLSCIRYGTTVIGLKNINANDNFAPVAMAA